MKKEVERNEIDGKGDIEEQTRALLDDAVRLEKEAFNLERTNTRLAVKVVQLKEAVKFWENLIQEDEDFIIFEKPEVETD